MYTVNIENVEKKELPGRCVYVLTQKFPIKNLTVGICEVPPKSTMPPHQHVQEETIFIINGFGYVVVDGVKELVNPGMLIFFPSDKEHFTSNESNDVMQFLFSFSPHVRTFAVSRSVCRTVDRGESVAGSYRRPAR